MGLTTGTRLGPYEVVAAIGAGGMGEVYRARDTKLNRDVALKILPASFASDPDRLARFHREAQVLASLNHPHIGAIYGFEDSGDTHALVLEFVDGPTLSDRIAEGPIPIDEALPIAIQITEALEAAHEQGIIHRDLKPANIKLRPDGTVKVLDFGLAKLASPAEAGHYSADGSVRLQADLSMSPTITSPALMTGVGVLLGTAAYMAPEQARGKAVDKRADIWAFGCVLFEMLTGTRAFGGDETTDVIVAIVSMEPVWTKLPAMAAPRLRELLERCLEKDPRARLRDIGDARIDIDRIRTRPAADVTSRRVSTPPARWIAAVLLAATASALVGWTLRSPATQRPTPVRFSFSLPAQTRLSSGIALSPDGTEIIYPAATSSGQSRLYMRRVDQFDSQPIAGTDGAEMPFFSPDGRWVGFFVATGIRKVLLPGGTPIEICKTPTKPLEAQSRGASWGDDDTIVFGGGLRRGLFRVPATGGTPQGLTRVDGQQGETSHGEPYVLPNGRDVLFTIGTGQGSRVALLKLQTGTWRTLFQGGNPRYVSSGQIMYVANGALRRIGFDLDRGAITGGALPVIDAIRWGSTAGVEFGVFAASDNGTLVFGQGPWAWAVPRRLVWVNRSGQAELLPAEAAPYLGPRVSPDGTRIAATKIVEDGTGKIWMIDTRRGTATPYAVNGANYESVWTPDGKRVAFVSNGDLAWAAADTSNTVEPLLRTDSYKRPYSWTPDGRTLATIEEHPESTGTDIMTMRIDGARTSEPFVATSASETEPMFSRDGRWLAYVSDESGRNEIYVTPFPGPGGHFRISADGGDAPLWSPNGREIFYRNGDAAIAATIALGPSVVVTDTHVLFRGAFYAMWGIGGNWDISADGRRFLLLQEPHESLPEQLNVVLDR